MNQTSGASGTITEPTVAMRTATPYPTHNRAQRRARNERRGVRHQVTSAASQMPIDTALTQRATSSLRNATVTIAFVTDSTTTAPRTTATTTHHRGADSSPPPRSRLVQVHRQIVPGLGAGRDRR